MNACEYLVRNISTSFPTPPVSFKILAKHGKDMPVSKAPPIKKGPLGLCYQNAFEFVQKNSYRGKEQFLYCEGWACSLAMGVPLEHAWVIDHKGEVIDPTWKAVDCEYFGVAFDWDRLLALMSKTEHYGILCNLYRIRSGEKRLSPDELYKVLERSIIKE